MTRLKVNEEVNRPPNSPNDWWKHNRRSVREIDTSWVGWDKLLRYFESIKEDNRLRFLFTALFEVGARATEITDATRDNFIIGEQAIKVENLPVLKCRRKVLRNCLIPRKNDMLFDGFTNFLEKIDDPEERLFKFGRTRAYQLVRSISDDLWNHWFRSQRAFYFVKVWKFNIFDLKDWFEWQRADTPLWYIQQSLTEQADKLGITEIPERRY